MRRRAQRFLAAQNPSAGVPAGNQVLGCRLQCPRTPHNHYGTPPWGPLGTLDLEKSKKSLFSPVSGALKKTQVPETLGLKIGLKVKFRQSEAVSSKLSHVEPLTNLL